VTTTLAYFTENVKDFILLSITFPFSCLVRNFDRKCRHKIIGENTLAYFADNSNFTKSVITLSFSINIQFPELKNKGRHEINSDKQSSLFWHTLAISQIVL
jgi:hypothetical protein